MSSQAGQGIAAGALGLVGLGGRRVRCWEPEVGNARLGDGGREGAVSQAVIALIPGIQSSYSG